ncbi:hypothetical protein Lal_00002692 [Lupinus albus]|nr:hypothetical protein Lal_00002692 [Lupinus albus]
MNSEASNLSCSEESKHIEMLGEVCQRRAEARLLDTSGKPGQNHTCKFPCMWLVCDNFFGFARTSGPITKWGCSLQHERTFSKLVRNGRHYPSPDLARASLALREKARHKSLSLLVLDHIPVRPHKRKSQCIFLSRRCLEWECSVGKVRKVAATPESEPKKSAY